MNPQPEFKSSMGCLTVLVIVTILMSYRSTGSPNPLTVYSSGSTFAKVAVSLLVIIFGAAVLQLLLAFLGRTIIAQSAGMPSEDVLCKGCAKPLLGFASSHGAPMMCIRCGSWWHSGPACFNRGRPRNAGPFHLCPNCRSASERDSDILIDPER